MNPTLTCILVSALALITPARLGAAEPLSVSGIYPHLTVFNSDPKRERPAMENLHLRPPACPGTR